MGLAPVSLLFMAIVSHSRIFDRPVGFGEDGSHDMFFWHLDLDRDKYLSREELLVVPGITDELLDYVFARLRSVGDPARLNRLHNLPADHLDYTEFMWFYRESDLYESIEFPAEPPRQLYSFPEWPGMRSSSLPEEPSSLSPTRFWKEYVHAHKGVVIRGALQGSTAFANWSDPEYLTAHFGSLEAKLETRVEARGDRMFSKSLNRSRATISEIVNRSVDGYVVSVVPQAMAWEIPVPVCVLCGSRTRPYLDISPKFTQFMTELEETSLWISRGPTRSQFHYDKENTFNCLVSGNPKKWVLMDTRLVGDTVPWTRQGGYDPIDDRRNNYTDWVGVDVDNLDLNIHKYLVGFPVEIVTQYPGDCVFLPYSMLHFAGHAGEDDVLQVAVSYMWLPEIFLNEQCALSDRPALPLAVFDTVWYYSGQGVIPQGLQDPRIIEAELTRNGWNPKGIFNFLPEDAKADNPALAYVLKIMTAVEPIVQRAQPVPLALWLHLSSAADLGSLPCNRDREYIVRPLVEMDRMLRFLSKWVGNK
jgi:hypothetical protein